MLGIDLKTPLTCQCSCESQTLGTKLTGNTPGTYSKQDACAPAPTKMPHARRKHDYMHCVGDMLEGGVSMCNV